MAGVLPRMRGHWRHRPKTVGQALAEFALILPVFLVICALAIDFGRLFYAYVAVVNAAKEGAVYGAQNPICATGSPAPTDPTSPPPCPDPNNVTWRVDNEASNLSGLTASLVECVPAGGGAAYTALKDCHQGDTYHVRATYAFRFVTPILGQYFGSGLTLQADSRAVVLNSAFSPGPGVSLTKYACFGSGCTPEVTPYLDQNNDLQYVSGNPGATITYQITATNVGNQALTGLAVTDTNGTLPLGSSNCLTLPASGLAVGSTWQCTYTTTAPNTNGQESLLLGNTATLTANGIQQRQATATVQVNAPQPGLSVAKYVSPYQLGGSGDGQPTWGTSSAINVSYNSQAPSATVWYELIVSNPGGTATTGIAISDALNGSSFSLPVGTANCPAPPTSLSPDASWSCLYSATFPGAGSGVIPNVATAAASSATTVTGTATVVVSQCAAPNAVIPNLIGLTKSGAIAAWTAAGFSASNLTTSGLGSHSVATQNVQAYLCNPTSTTMTATK